MLSVTIPCLGLIREQGVYIHLNQAALYELNNNCTWKPKRESKWMQRKKNESEIKYLGFLCVLLQCMCEAEKEAWAERWRWRWRWRRKRRRTFTCEMGRLTERPVRNNTSSSEWHQAVGMNIIKQKCRVMGDQVQFKVEGIHQVSVRKVSLNCLNCFNFTFL